MKISVTQEDIAVGVKLDCENCPIAHSMERAFKTDNVEVDSYIELFADNVRYEAADAKSAGVICDFISHFDSGLPVNPVEFEIRKVDNE